ncbi:MAG: hypothetical protein HYZ53_15190 [Planctomycetes bacterium]|nr:hypothetical protein [Planctomycetota bacterium]
MLDAISGVLSDPFHLFRLLVILLSVYELTGLVLDWRAGYRRWVALLERIGGRYRLHELLRATVRLQLLSIVVRRRGWDELRILLVQVAAAALGLLTWMIER